MQCSVPSTWYSTAKKNVGLPDWQYLTLQCTKLDVGMLARVKFSYYENCYQLFILISLILDHLLHFHQVPGIFGQMSLLV